MPVVERVSPPADALDVPLNAGIRVRFNEVINTLSVTEDTILVTDGSDQVVPCTISFANNRDVFIVPHSPLAASRLYELTIMGVEDHAGHAVLPQTTQFTTGTVVDTTRPTVAASTPFNGATDVPVNSPILITVDEPLDPITIDGLFVRENTTFTEVEGSLSLSADGQVISFVPNTVLAVNRNYSVFISGTSITDLSNNSLSLSLNFTTGTEEDSTAPTVVSMGPGNDLVDVPTNAKVVVRFDEPIQSVVVDQVGLSAGGENITVIRTLSDGNRQLTLTPVLLLDADTVHTVTVGTGVLDLAGNALASEVTTQFTTGSSIDLLRPTLLSVDPANGAVDVPTNMVAQVQFSERVNPGTVTSGTFFIEQSSTGVDVVGSVVVAADGMSAMFTPTVPLNVGTNYRVRTLSGIQDLAGNTWGSTTVPASFTTGSGP